MKENLNIDELLNAFIDGELTERQRTEAQRLIGHDKRIARRLGQLQKCKMLVGSLPSAEAPAEMVEDVKAALERRTLLSQQQKGFDEREGARHLLVRKVLTAAAMIGLVAVFGAVIYTIIAPHRTDKPVAVEHWMHPAEKIPMQNETPDTVPSFAKSTDITEFNGTLELKTTTPIAVNAFISRAIEDNGLLGKVAPKSLPSKTVYTLDCSSKALGLLLADLENVWAKFDSATLFVDTEQATRQVVVDAVSSGQVVEIAGRDSLKERIELAKNFAALNNMAEQQPGRDILAVAGDGKPDLTVIPKPVLTSGEKKIKKPPARPEGDKNVHLTIVVLSSE